MQVEIERIYPQISEGETTNLKRKVEATYSKTWKCYLLSPAHTLGGSWNGYPSLPFPSRPPPPTLLSGLVRDRIEISEKCKLLGKKISMRSLEIVFIAPAGRRPSKQSRIPAASWRKPSRRGRQPSWAKRPSCVQNSERIFRCPKKANMREMPVSTAGSGTLSFPVRRGIITSKPIWNFENDMDYSLVSAVCDFFFGGAKSM